MLFNVKQNSPIKLQSTTASYKSMHVKAKEQREPAIVNNKYSLC